MDNLRGFVTKAYLSEACEYNCLSSFLGPGDVLPEW